MPLRQEFIHGKSHISEQEYLALVVALVMLQFQHFIRHNYQI